MAKKILCVIVLMFVLVGALASCECDHEYADGVCEKCNEPCSHQYVDAVCSVCGKTCTHSYEKGICTDCGAKNLKTTDLTDRTFKFAYFELSWTEGTTDQQQELLRRQFNATNDEELFDELHQQYNFVLSLAGAYLIDEYAFYEETSGKNGFVDYVMCISDHASNRKTYRITRGAVITIDGRTFHYDEGLIYTLEESNDYEGITIKEVFIEKPGA